MKLAPRAVAGFLRHPDPAARLILVYGPDGGLVRERAAALARTVVADLSDPFRVAELPAARLLDDPGRLADEAAAMAMTGGRRVVRIDGAGDRLSAILERFLADPPGDALVVVEAGELGPRSSLRKLCEAAGNAAALPCYADDPGALAALVEEVLGGAGLGIEPAAMDYLKGALGGDRGVSRRELEKLAAYMGPGGGRVGLAEAEACIGDSAALGLDDVVFAAAGGDMAMLERSLGRALAAGENPVSVIRAAQRHLQRLHLVGGLTAGGAPLDAALKRLRPPLHFRREPAFRAQTRAWPATRAAQALDILTEAEIGCKTTGAPAEALCRQALLRLAAAARAARR